MEDEKEMAGVVKDLLSQVMLHKAAETAIQKYEIGYPCMFGEVVVRIVGESGEGSWGEINGKQYYSTPLVATPHGTIFKVGVMLLKEITEDGMAKLLGYEEELKTKGIELYAGKLNDITIKKS